MEQMAKFKVSNLLKKHITRQLYLRNIPFKEVEEEGNMYLELPVKVSGKEFHRIVTRARMEHLQQEDGYITTICPKCHENPKITTTPRSERTTVRCPCGYIVNCEINF